MWYFETQHKNLDLDLRQLTSDRDFMYNVIPSLDIRLSTIESEVRDNREYLSVLENSMDTMHARQSNAENRISVLENPW